MTDQDRFDPYGHLIVPDPDESTDCGACEGHGWLVGESGRRSVRCPWCRPDAGSVRLAVMAAVFVATVAALVVFL